MFGTDVGLGVGAPLITVLVLRRSAELHQPGQQLRSGVVTKYTDYLRVKLRLIGSLCGEIWITS